MIQVQDLAKYYGGKRALGPVSFEIDKGESVGFLGLNGAGKTTALRILACDLRPSGGRIRIEDVDAVENPHEVRKRVGFLPEHPPVYPDMTVGSYLAFAGKLRGMPAGDVKRRVPEVEEVTHLREAHDELIRNLSHGYRQRVGVAQAIVHQPRLLILDEPTRGLDPVQIVEMRAMINRLKQDHTVLISSHILPEISETCDRLLVLGEGNIIGAGTEEELSARLAQVKRLSVTVKPGAGADEGAVEKVISEVDGVTAVTRTGKDAESVTFEAACAEDRRAEVCAALVKAGHGVLRLDVAQKKLESVFMQLVKGGDHGRN